MQINDFILHVESLLFASNKPLNVKDLTATLNVAFEFISERVAEEQVEKALEVLVEKYQSPHYCFHIVESGGGWQFLSKKEFHRTIATLDKNKYLKRLSNAALETLAIIAYRQPITKAEIEAIRGVNCDYAVQKLIEKELIIIAGRREELVGKPLIYSTSQSFMDYFGINSPQDLPQLEEMGTMTESIEQLIENTTNPKENETDA